MVGATGPRWAEIAYDAIAPAYDDFTAHHDYELWVGNLLRALELHGLSAPGRLLDVGCGTGKSLVPMLERGWSVCAFDVSPKMVELARAKVGDDVDLTVGDMREMPKFGEFDLVWALADAINYLMSVEELEAALRGMRTNLAPNGMALFDANTLLAYRTFFSEDIDMESCRYRMLWRGRSDRNMAPSSIAEATFEAFPMDGARNQAVPCEVHRERHFSVSETERALDRSGLECLDVFGNTQDGALQLPLDEAVHGKAVYVARAAS